MPDLPKQPCALKPGEVCQWCFSVGAPPAKPAKPPRPKCAVCEMEFTRGQKKRLYRGKWVHLDCV